MVMNPSHCHRLDVWDKLDDKFSGNMLLDISCSILFQVSLKVQQDSQQSVKEGDSGVSVEDCGGEDKSSECASQPQRDVEEPASGGNDHRQIQQEQEMEVSKHREQEQRMKLLQLQTENHTLREQARNYREMNV